MSEINYKSQQEIIMKIVSCDDIFAEDCLLMGGDSQRRLVFVDGFFHRCGQWKDRIYKYFAERDINAKIVPIECSEDTKDLETLLCILGHMERFNLLRRSEPVIAIGGGVLTDMVGFASSMFRRGVPYIKVPTTLLGMVDAGLGAKTSINHFDRRNRLGSYFPPILTCIDRQFLQTLDPKEITVAMGEIIKIAVIKDAELFEFIEKNLEYVLENKFVCEAGKKIIDRSSALMMEELEPNLWEKDLERVVDFGHTFSPIPEMKSLTDTGATPLAHGEAVALDVLFSSKLSVMRGMLTKEEYNRILNLVEKSKLPVSHKYFDQAWILWDSLMDATRHRNGKQNAPVPTGIGHSIFLLDITLEEIERVIEYESHN